MTLTLKIGMYRVCEIWGLPIMFPRRGFGGIRFGVTGMRRFGFYVFGLPVQVSFRQIAFEGWLQESRGNALTTREPRFYRQRWL